MDSPSLVGNAGLEFYDDATTDATWPNATGCKTNDDVAAAGDCMSYDSASGQVCVFRVLSQRVCVCRVLSQGQVHVCRVLGHAGCMCVG